MPPVIAAVGAVVGTLGTAGTIALAVGIASAAYSVYAVSKSKKLAEGSASAADRKQTFRSANAAKQVILGDVEVSGPIVFAMESGAPDGSGAGEIIDLVIPLAGHPCTACLSLRMGDAQFSKIADTAEGSHWVLDRDGIRHGEIWYYSRPVDAVGVPPSLAGVNQWEADMIGRGQTFIHARLRSDNSQWPGGIEDLVARVQGAAVLDPRTGTHGFSTNPALHGLHYIRRYLLVPEEEILLDTFIHAANISDETVQRASVTEARYRCDPVFGEEDDPQEVLGNIAASMGGEFVRSGGLWGARAGSYNGPATRTIGRHEIMGSVDIRVSLPLDERINTLTGQYLEPAQGYNLTDFPPLSRPEYIDQDGRERGEDMSFDFVQSATQAQALGWIELEKRRRGASVSGTFALSAVDAVVNRVVQIDLPGLSGLEFRVSSWKLAPSGQGIQLELMEDHPDIWTGQPADIVPPLLPGELAGNDPRVVPAITGLTFTRTPDALNQHGVLGWQGHGSEYEVVLEQDGQVLRRERVPGTILPLTLPHADRLFTVTVTAINGFGVRSPAVARTISLTLDPPVLSVIELNSRDHWLEVNWTGEPVAGYELELLTLEGQGAYRTTALAPPVHLGWFHPGIYRLRARAMLGVTSSAWSDELTVQIDTLRGPLPIFRAESKDPLASGGMLSFSSPDPRSERIEYQVSGAGFNVNGDSNGQPVRLPPMLPGSYQFRARSQWRDVFSGWNAITQTLSENLSAPQNLTFTASDEPGLLGRLDWDSAASQHRVTLIRERGSEAVIEVVVSGNAYQVPILKVGSYRAEVVAIGRVETSSAAHLVFHAQAPLAPANVIFTPAEHDAAVIGEVSWQPVSGSSGYAVRLCQGDRIIVESRTSDNRWPISPLSPGSYEVQVASISLREGAQSDWSGVAFSLAGLMPPDDLSASESLIGSGIQIISQVVLSCASVVGASAYQFEYQLLGAGSWSGIQSGSALSATLNAVPPGEYTFRVRAVSGAWQSGYASMTFRVNGTARPPASLTDLRLHAQAGATAQLSWTLSRDADVLTGGSIQVRFTHLSGKQANWASAIPVTDRLPGNATLASVPLRSGTYLVKPVNASGYWAENAARVICNMAGLIGYNRVVERVEPDDWPGVKNKARIEAGGALTLESNAIGEIAGNAEPPFYIMHQPLDLGAVITARLTMDVDNSLYCRDTIDERSTLIDDWPKFDGAVPDSVDIRYEVSQTDDDPQSASAAWSDWTQFLMGEFRGRGFRLRVVMQGDTVGAAITLTKLRLIADVPDRTERGVNLEAPASGLRVSYNVPFLAPAAIGITAQALPVGGRFVLSDEDAQGFTIHFYRDDSAINAIFNYTAISYGEAA